MAGRLVAAMARPGLRTLVFWSRVSRLLGGAGCAAAYREDAVTGQWLVERWEAGGGLRALSAGHDLFALVAGGRGAVCCSGLLVAKNGSPVELFVAVRGPVQRSAALGAPAPARRVGAAVLCLFARRLLEVEGVSLVRLAARLARHGGGEAAVLALVRKPGRAAPAPLVYYASEGGACVEEAPVPGLGVAFHAGPCGGGEARPPGVFHARPQGGVVRVEYVELGEALRI